MILRLLMLLFAFSLFTAPAEAGFLDTLGSYFKKPAPHTPPKIRVLVAHDKPGVVLEVKGKYKIYDPYRAEHISTRFIGKRKFIQAISDGIKWGEEFPGVHQLKIVPDHPRTTTLVDGIEYPGSIYVYDIGGSISVVNEVYIEDYLKSILTLEYRRPLPEEALRAIAIVARTNAYYQVSHPKNKFWDVDGSKVGYQGYAVTQRPSGIGEAIKDTRYMVMLRKPDSSGAKIPFSGHWNDPDKAPQGKSVVSDVTLAQAVQMAEKGDHAAQILSKAFPGISISLIQYSTEQHEATAQN